MYGTGEWPGRARADWWTGRSRWYLVMTRIHQGEAAPGSYATYTKVVNSDGKTIGFYKTTYAPDGSIVHVKVKYP